MMLDGKKTWEIRGSNTKIRGKIALIKSGTGKIYGMVELVNVKNLTLWDLTEYVDKHCIYSIDREKMYRQPRAWVMESPVRFKEPIPYKHPQGAVIWVNLPDDLFTEATTVNCDLDGNTCKAGTEQEDECSIVRYFKQEKKTNGIDMPISKCPFRNGE
jgi:hypothetical protein